VRKRYAFFELYALSFAVRERHAQHLRDSVALRLFKQQSQRLALPFLDALRFVHSDG
jgi:hypothetical protein